MENLLFLFSKRKIIFFGIISFLIVLLFIMFIYVGINSQVNPQNDTPVSTQITLAPVQRKTIQDEINSVIYNDLPDLMNKENIAVENYRFYKDGWAISTIAPKDNSTDPANVILKNQNGAWKIIAGPGTYFEEDELISKGVPPAVAEDINTY